MDDACGGVWMLRGRLSSPLCGMLAAAPQGSIEEQWRADCLAFARVRKLGHVADMRIFYVVRCPLLSSSPIV